MSEALWSFLSILVLILLGFHVHKAVGKRALARGFL